MRNSSSGSARARQRGLTHGQPYTSQFRHARHRSGAGGSGPTRGRVCAYDEPSNPCNRRTSSSSAWLPALSSLAIYNPKPVPLWWEV